MRRKMSVPIFCRWHVQRSDGRQSHYFFIASSHTIHVSLSHLRFSISSFFYHFGWYYQAMTSRAFWLRVGFGSGLTKKFGFRVGFGYWLYLAVLGCTGIRLHWAVLGCGGVGLMSASLFNCCQMSCPLWTNWSGGGITRPNSPFYPKLSRWSSQYQLPHPNLSGSSPWPAMWSPPRGPDWTRRRWRISWLSSAT